MVLFALIFSGFEHEVLRDLAEDIGMEQSCMVTILAFYNKILLKNLSKISENP